jgi:hypothetical protein
MLPTFAAIITPSLQLCSLVIRCNTDHHWVYSGCRRCCAIPQDVASECGVRAMPTFQAFFNGEKVDELCGAEPGKLQAMIAK